MSTKEKKKEIEDLKQKLEELDYESNEFNESFIKLSKIIGLPAALHYKSYIKQDAEKK